VSKSTNAARVLVTRPKHQQSSFLARCADAGLDTLSLPCIDILPVDCSIDTTEIAAAEFVFFTSRNAVEFAHSIQPLPWKGASVYCIGRATQRALSHFNQNLAVRLGFDHGPIIANPPGDDGQIDGIKHWLKSIKS